MRHFLSVSLVYALLVCSPADSSSGYLKELRMCSTYFDTAFSEWVQETEAINRKIYTKIEFSNTEIEMIWGHLKRYHQTYFTPSDCEVSGLKLSDFVEVTFARYLDILDFSYFTSEYEMLEQERVIVFQDIETSGKKLEDDFNKLLDF